MNTYQRALAYVTIALGLGGAACEKNGAEPVVPSALETKIVHAAAKAETKEELNQNTPENTVDLLVGLYNKGEHLNVDLLTPTLYDKLLQEKKRRPQTGQKLVHIERHRIITTTYSTQDTATVTMEVIINGEKEEKEFPLVRTYDSSKKKHKWQTGD